MAVNGASPSMDEKKGRMLCVCAATCRPRLCSRGCVSTATVTDSMSVPGRAVFTVTVRSSTRTKRATTTAR